MNEENNKLKEELLRFISYEIQLLKQDIDYKNRLLKEKEEYYENLTLKFQEQHISRMSNIDFKNWFENLPE